MGPSRPQRGAPGGRARSRRRQAPAGENFLGHVLNPVEEVDQLSRGGEDRGIHRAPLALDEAASGIADIVSLHRHHVRAASFRGNRHGGGVLLKDKAFHLSDAKRLSFCGSTEMPNEHDTIDDTETFAFNKSLHQLRLSCRSYLANGKRRGRVSMPLRRLGDDGRRDAAPPFG